MQEQIASPFARQMFQQPEVIGNNTQVAVNNTQQFQLIKRPDTITDDFIHTLGKSQAASVGKISESVLKTVKTSDMDEFGTMITSLLSQAKQIDPNKLSDKGIINKIRHMFVNVKERVATEMNDVDKSLERLSTEMVVHEKAQMDTVSTLEKMYLANIQEHQSLEKLTADIQMLHDSELEKVKQIDISAFTTMELQQHNDKLDILQRLDKRRHDLVVIMRLAEQTAPEIRQMQSNSRMLVDKFNNIRELTIPVLKKTLSLAIINIRQAKAAKLVKSVDDTTNAALMKNSEMLKQNAADITRASQRSVVDVETVEKISNDLIQMLEECNTIKATAITARKENEKRMVDCNARLLETMKKTGTF